MSSARLPGFEAAVNWCLIALFTLGGLGCLLAAISQPLSLLGAATSAIAVVALSLRTQFAYGFVAVVGILGLAQSRSHIWLAPLNVLIILAALFVWRGVRKLRAGARRVEA